MQPIDLVGWIDEHREQLQPPVGNAQIWDEGDFIVTIVGGPNQRTDFHDDPCDEFFYQLRGDMVLRVWDDGAPRDIPIREGQVFLLPGPRAPLAAAAGARLGRSRDRAAASGGRARRLRVVLPAVPVARAPQRVPTGQPRRRPAEGVRRVLRRRRGAHLPGLRLGPPRSRGAARSAARRRGVAARRST